MTILQSSLIHGSTGIRKVYNQIHLLEDLEKWRDLKSVIQITSEREINEKRTNETRLYISSLNDEAETFNKYIRMHWGVENPKNMSFGNQ